MNARFFRRGLSAFALLGTAAMLAGAMNQGCVADQPEEAPAAPAPQPISRSAILDDPKLNSVLGSLPGAIVTDIKEKRK